MFVNSKIFNLHSKKKKLKILVAEQQNLKVLVNKILSFLNKIIPLYTFSIKYFSKLNHLSSHFSQTSTFFVKKIIKSSLFILLFTFSNKNKSPNQHPTKFSSNFSHTPRKSQQNLTLPSIRKIFKKKENLIPIS